MKLLWRIVGMVAVLAGVVVAMNRWVEAKKAIVLEKDTLKNIGEFQFTDSETGFDETDFLT